MNDQPERPPRSHFRQDRETIERRNHILAKIREMLNATTTTNTKDLMCVMAGVLAQSIAELGAPSDYYERSLGLSLRETRQDLDSLSTLVHSLVEEDLVGLLNRQRALQQMMDDVLQELGRYGRGQWVEGMCHTCGRRHVGGQPVCQCSSR